MRANIMNEKKIPEFATILAFDVSIDSDAQVLKYVCFGFELLHILFDFPGVFIDDGGRVERANFLRRDHLPSFRSIFCLHEW